MQRPVQVEQRRRELRDELLALSEPERRHGHPNLRRDFVRHQLQLPDAGQVRNGLRRPSDERAALRDLRHPLWCWPDLLRQRERVRRHQDRRQQLRQLRKQVRDQRDLQELGVLPERRSRRRRRRRLLSKPGA